jgi:hypothetical protein
MHDRDPSLDLKQPGASSLRRRRDFAAYSLIAARYQGLIARTLGCGLLLALLAFPVALRWISSPSAESSNRGIPLDATTTGNIDRFNLEHKVTSGDSISKISVRYYNRWSPEYDALLRQANPDLPTDPRQLTTSIIVKVPLQ